MSTDFLIAVEGNRTAALKEEDYTLLYCKW
jgi:hypothetical protein